MQNLQFLLNKHCRYRKKKLIVNGKKSVDLQKKEVPTHDWKLLKRELNFIAWAWLYELMQEQSRFKKWI